MKTNFTWGIMGVEKSVLSADELKAFNYLEQHRLYLGMSIQAINKMDDLIRERNSCIRRYCSGQGLSNEEIDFHIDCILKNNEEIKNLLHL